MVGYSLHQLLRYVAAHSGWHLLLPVKGGPSLSLGRRLLFMPCVPRSEVVGFHLPLVAQLLRYRVRPRFPWQRVQLIVQCAVSVAAIFCGLLHFHAAPVPCRGTPWVVEPLGHLEPAHQSKSSSANAAASHMCFFQPLPVNPGEGSRTLHVLGLALPYPKIRFEKSTVT